MKVVHRSGKIFRNEKSPNDCRGQQLLRLYSKYIIIRREKKSKKDLGEGYT